MNDLSWLIYLAGVSGNISGALFFVTLAAGLASVAFVIGVLDLTEGPSFYGYDSEETKERKLKEYEDLKEKVSKGARIASFVFVASLGIGAVLPSRDTVYAIAASEIGEDVVKSETGQKAAKAIQAWLDKQIGGEDE